MPISVMPPLTVTSLQNVDNVHFDCYKGYVSTSILQPESHYTHQQLFYCVAFRGVTLPSNLESANAKTINQLRPN